MKMWTDFKAFLLKQNVIALAVAVVIGVALGKLVTAFVDDFIMPIVNAGSPSTDWKTMVFNVGPVKFLLGDFLSATLNFIIIAFVVWRISKAFVREGPKTPMRPCPYCKMEIDKSASRCAHCTSQVTAA